jgi:hypothetical protein
VSGGLHSSSPLIASGHLDVFMNFRLRFGLPLLMGPVTYGEFIVPATYQSRWFLVPMVDSGTYGIYSLVRVATSYGSRHLPGPGAVEVSRSQHLSMVPGIG